MKMWCSKCGRERTLNNAAADPGPCVCGNVVIQSVPPEGWTYAGSADAPQFESGFGNA